MFACIQRKSVESTLFQRRGTGIPEEENRQSHAILTYGMNIAQMSPLLENCQFST
jgi:glutamate mutase epsilon subunit